MSEGYDTAAELYQAQGEENNKAAVDAREDERAEPETREEYIERITNTPGIFGDIDTTAGTGADQTDTLSSKNELATVAAAEAEAEGEVEPDQSGVADPVARRQPDIGATVPSADDVEAQLDDEPDTNPDEPEQPTQLRPRRAAREDPDQKNAEELISDINSSEDLEFVEAQLDDDRVTVQRAAVARKEELEANA